MAKRAVTRKRNQEIFRLRNKGMGFDDIAARFGLSRQAVQNICRAEKDRLHLWQRMTPFARELPKQLRGALQKHYGEDILRHPERIVAAGAEELRWVDNIGPIYRHRLVEVLTEQGYLDDPGAWLFEGK